MKNEKPISVAALTGGVNVPSARFRLRQLIPSLSDYGIQVREYISSLSTYPPQTKILRPVWAMATLTMRLPDVLATRKYDLVFLQRELLSTFFTLERYTQRPRILDVDDAIFLRKGGGYARKLAKACDMIICGNKFLSENFSKWNKNIIIIPTAVDTKRYKPLKAEKETKQQIIGWIGSSANFKYLYQIEEALSYVLKVMPNTKLLIISDYKPKFSIVYPDKVDFINWSADRDVNDIQEMDIGIMPLADTDWEKGKCSFKMLQYMACGLPVVVSPYGMNKEILEKGNIGFGPISTKEWKDALIHLLQNNDERYRMGQIGREIVLNNYSIDVISPKLAGAMKRMVL